MMPRIERETLAYQKGCSSQINVLIFYEINPNAAPTLATSLAGSPAAPGSAAWLV